MVLQNEPPEDANILWGVGGRIPRPIKGDGISTNILKTQHILKGHCNAMKESSHYHMSLMRRHTTK